ncbi:hypothetical protein B0H13DRAFT_1630832, partial [Mycena leptocephala]
GITTKPDAKRIDRFDGNLKESSPGAKDAVKIDLAVKDISSLLVYTKSIKALPDVVFADERLLLVTKIQSVPARSEAAGGIENDILEMVFCLKHVESPLPADLLGLVDEDMWEKFWKRVFEYTDRDTGNGIYWAFKKIGLKCGESFKPSDAHDHS